MKLKSKILFFILQNKNAFFLLGRRRISETETFWWLPGGSVENSESAFEAAVREVKEELIPGTAIEAILQRYLQHSIMPPSASYITDKSENIIFMVQLPKDLLGFVPEILDEFEEIKWHPVSSLPANMSREFLPVKKVLTEAYLISLSKDFDFVSFL
jgi:8-oxo-dGTP pyrophosphatase MutT (NUDIX family)